MHESDILSITKNSFIRKQITKEHNNFKHPSWDYQNKFSKEICLEAEIEYTIREETFKKEWRSKIDIYKSDNPLFTLCKPMNGISKDMFLKRFLAFRPVVNSQRKNCENLLSLHCDKIHPENVINERPSVALNSLDTICCIFTTLEWFNQACEWLTINSAVLWNNLAGCLLLQEHMIVIDVCVTIAFLMYKIPYQIPESIKIIFENLIFITTNCCIEFNDYLSNQQESEQLKLQNQDEKHFYSIPFKSSNTDFLLLSASIYCQTFFINYNFNESVLCQLMDFYNEMSEMCRYIYIDLLELIVDKLKDNVNNHPLDSKWINIAERFLEKFTSIYHDTKHLNKHSFMCLYQVLKNLVLSKIPNYTNKMKLQDSIGEKLILSKKNNSCVDTQSTSPEEFLKYYINKPNDVKNKKPEKL